MRREQTELTVLCLIHRDGRYLLQNRVKKDWQGYALPGGHVESGESIVDAVVREMREETGLTIREPHLCGIKQFPIEGGRYLVFLFETEQFSGNLISSEEGTMHWVAADSIRELPLVADFEDLLDVMLSDTLTEFQYLVEGDNWIVVKK